MFESSSDHISIVHNNTNHYSSYRLAAIYKTGRLVLCIRFCLQQGSYLLNYTVLSICTAKYYSALNKGAIMPDRTFVHALRLNLRQSWHIGLLCLSDLQCKEQLTSVQMFCRKPVNNRTFVHTEDKLRRR